MTPAPSVLSMVNNIMGFLKIYLCCRRSCPVATSSLPASLPWWTMSALPPGYEPSKHQPLHQVFPSAWPWCPNIIEIPRGKQRPSTKLSLSFPSAWLSSVYLICAGSTLNGRDRSRWSLLSSSLYPFKSLFGVLFPLLKSLFDWNSSIFLQITQFFQVNLIFPTIYIICSILVTIVPMMASPKETGDSNNDTTQGCTNSPTPRRDRMCDNCERDPGLLRPCVRVSSPKTSPSPAILRSQLALTKKKFVPPSPTPTQA